MQEGKYYSWKLKRVLSHNDGCSYDDWQKEPNDFSFSVNLKGFFIFVPFCELSSSDEYSDGDPYRVEINLNSQFQRRRIEATLDLLVKVSHRNGSSLRILDIGCGEGYITSEIQKKFPKAEISGLDYSLSSIVTAVDKFPGIDFVVANAYDPPYAPNYFDVVVCNNLWEHVPDPLVLLDKIRRITKPGGYLIISTPSRYRTSNLVRALFGRAIRFNSKLHVTEYTVGQVIEQLRFGKYKVEKVLSKSISNEGQSIQGIILYTFVKPILKFFLSIVSSHHSLESTVFYLAQKVKEA